MVYSTNGNGLFKDQINDGSLKSSNIETINAKTVNMGNVSWGENLLNSQDSIKTGINVQNEETSTKIDNNSKQIISSNHLDKKPLERSIFGNNPIAIHEGRSPLFHAIEVNDIRNPFSKLNEKNPFANIEERRIFTKPLERPFFEPSTALDIFFSNNRGADNKANILKTPAESSSLSKFPRLAGLPDFKPITKTSEFKLPKLPNASLSSQSRSQPLAF